MQDEVDEKAHDFHCGGLSTPYHRAMAARPPPELRAGMRPVLNGAHVRLRPAQIGDAAAMWAATREPENCRLTGTDASFTLAQVRAHLRRVADDPDRIDLAITRVDDADHWLGEVVLNQIDWTQRRAHFRILLGGPLLYGQGLGSEATRLLVAHGFDVLDLHRIELEVFDFNPRARHVYEKAGFEIEGVRRDALWWDGVWHASILMAQLKPDHERRHRDDTIIRR
jgi:RimJ/RimL family protein N-acetyltransferase